MTKQAGKLDLNWAQAGGSALAALSSAVLLSTLGATGTMIGAAVGSVVVTVGGAVYSHYLSLSRERMAAARSAAVGAPRLGRGPRLTPTRRSVEAAARTVARSPERYPLLAASAHGAPPPRPGHVGNPGTSRRQQLRGLRWRPALAASLGLFLLVMSLIVSMELVTGRALSSYTGGSGADGPRTSISLLGSTTAGKNGGDSGTTGPADRGDRTADRTFDNRFGDRAGSGADARSADDTGGDSTAGAPSDADAPQPDTATTDREPGAPPEPAPEPTPDTSPEPTPEAPAEPAPTPTTQAPAAEEPAPSTGVAVGESAAAPARRGSIGP